MKHPKPLKAFSLIELAVVVLLIGLVTIVALNGKSLLIKANCVASSFGTKTITDNLDNSTALTTNRNTNFENCVNSAMGIATVVPTPTCSGSPCSSCKTLLAENPGIASGTYTIDPDGASTGLSPFTAYCDMTTDGGGWTLVLNYLHKANTNPATRVRSLDLPVLGSTSLGTDESLPAPTSSIYWGHAGNSMMNKFNFTEMMFQGKSDVSSKVSNFKTSLAGCITYFKTGSGSCNGLNSSFVALSGHTTLIPASADGYTSGAGDSAMLSHPFFQGGSYHWGIGGKWDYGQGCNGNPCDDPAYYIIYNTHQKIWIR